MNVSISDFNQSGLDIIDSHASINGVDRVQAAVDLRSPLITKISLWPDIVNDKEEDHNQFANICTSERGDLLTSLSRQISDSIQFPINTVFLHSIGCVAAALTKSFSIKYYFDTIPCNIYILTAQPPSSGKSAVNSKLFTPVKKAFDSLNERTETERRKLTIEIAKLRKELDKDKSKDGDIDEILDKIQDKEDRISIIPEWDPSLTDATIEAAEQTASKQQGMFNIVSAEAESVNVILGAVYGDDKGGKKANHGLVLSAWDGEYVNSKRITRQGYKGHVRSTISVIAQDDIIDTILSAGGSGRGLTERFLLLAEPSLLGSRDHFKPYSFDKSIYRRYESMIDNIVSEEDEIVLTFSSDSERFIKSYLSRMEPTISEDGENSNALLTGFIGKADKHIRKLASILHCVDNWQDGGDRSRTINDDYMAWAIGIFDELANTFKNAGNSLGYVGFNAEVEKVKEYVLSKAQSGKLKVNFKFLRDSLKNCKPFKGSRNLTKKLRCDVLPELQSMNYIVVSGNDIHINPRLK